MQQRVFQWQRNVAGQPVCRDPKNADADFVQKSLGFVKSEWFDEYIPHLSKASEFTGFDGIKAATEMLADDIGDAAFTLLGYLNARGLSVGDSKTQGILIANEKWGVDEVTDIINMLGNHKAPTLSNEEVSDAVARALMRLNSLSYIRGFSFIRAFNAVCDSNDTKLWTAEEVRNQLPDDCLAIELPLPKEVLRRWRVINKDRKLIKSPSFAPPDFSTITATMCPLTWF